MSVYCYKTESSPLCSWAGKYRLRKLATTVVCCHWRNAVIMGGFSITNTSYCDGYFSQSVIRHRARWSIADKWGHWGPSHGCSLMKSRIAMKHCAVTKSIKFISLPIMRKLVCQYKLSLRRAHLNSACMLIHRGTIGPIDGDASCSISLGNMECSWFHSHH